MLVITSSFLCIRFVNDPNDIQRLTFSLTVGDENGSTAVVFFDFTEAERFTGTSIVDWRREGIETMGQKVMELLECCKEAQHVLHLRLMVRDHPPSFKKYQAPEREELQDSDGKAPGSSKKRQSSRIDKSPSKYMIKKRLVLSVYLH